MFRFIYSVASVATVFCLASATGFASDEAAGGASPIELFEQRIMPIFKSPKPSSCVQCHLASVDLKEYILPSHEQTFVSLRDEGLIDVKNPDNSKILNLIGMGEKDLDKGARLIHARTRKAEYDAFAAWIKACCADPKIRDLPPLEGVPTAKPKKPDPVIEYTRKSRVVDSFARNVWSQRMRCFPCHTPHELDASNPKHEKPIARHKELVKKFGQKVNIFRESPEATLRHLMISSRRPRPDRFPLINVDDPAKSLLVLKPTSKLPKKGEDGKFEKPSSGEPVSHMGGLKMHVNDQSYKSFIAWIQDYSRVVGDQYESADELPLDNWYPSKQALRVKNAPDSWDVLTSVQLFVHAWNDAEDSWSAEPVAFTQGTVTPRRMVNGMLFLLVPADSDKHETWDREGAVLPDGKYLVKTYVDSDGRLAEDPALFLTETDYFGQATIETPWKEGFRDAKVLDGPLLQK
ncbi:MAG TPA: hypothetical protein EYG03_22125 [Planctomycetes bacterium]|nr:hypothetical protein [Fuerstiella sp.]HIK94650.1 hypothetical protein [Planctomycetota bacterium]